MYQHIDLMAAQSMAREREQDLQATLRQRQGIAQRSTSSLEPQPSARHHRVHDLLVRVHLAHVPIH